MLRAVVLGVVAIGCFNPTVPAGIECERGLCPKGLICDDGICRERPLGADAAAAVDAAAVLPDAGCSMVTFREGVNGYDSTADTTLFSALPDQDEGNATRFIWDQNGFGGDTVALLRFEDIIGAGAGQVPAGANVTAATLTLTVYDAGNEAGSLQPIRISWDEQTTYNTFGPAPGVDDADVDDGVAPLPFLNGAHDIIVTGEIQRYAAGEPNRGWALVAANEAGVRARSSEADEPSERPLLTVSFCRP